MNHIFIAKGIGTEIEVKDLFFNTPARLKFLRKEITEFRAIKDTVLVEALANPNISITLLNDDKEVLKTSGNGIKNTILEIFGKNTLENIVSFPLGYLGNISLNRSNKDFIFIFINGRPVKSQIIENALIDGYYTKLMKGRYPFAVIFLEIDPKDVDVNVHPTKKIVKFSDEAYIYNLVYDEVNKKLFGDEDFIAPIIKPKEEKRLEVKSFEKDTLKTEKISFDIPENEEISDNKKEKNRFEDLDFQVREPQKTFEVLEEEKKEDKKIEEIKEIKKEEGKNFSKDSELLKINSFFKEKEKNIKKSFANNEKTDKLESSDEKLKKYEDFSEKEKNIKKSFANNEKTDKLESSDEKLKKYEDFSKDKLKEKNPKRENYKIIGQLADTYILVERDENLEIYDQHIIHERILYEKYKRMYDNKEISTQQLLVPIKFKISNKERELIEENIDILKKFGFEVDFFDKNDILIRGIPNFKISPIKFKISNKERELIEENIDILKKFGFEVDFFDKNDILIRGIPNFKISCSIEELMKNIIEDLKNSKIKNTLLEESIIMSSCKGAIKANQKLTFDEMEILLKKLFEIEEYTCPHGRPILLKMSLTDIERHFGRLGSK